MTVLEEMGALVRARPGVDAPAAEVADWYLRKAAMLRHVAGFGGADAEQAAVWAVLAEAHAARLVGGIARPGKGSVSWLVLGEVA